MNPSQPRFEQPFTLQEALQFEPGTITSGQYLPKLEHSQNLGSKIFFGILFCLLDLYAEIARLQNSLQHLGETQSVIEEHVASDPDPDLLEALSDNRVVMCAPSVLLYACLI